MNKSRFALQILWILTLVLLVLQLPDLLLYRSVTPVVMGFYDRDYFIFLCLYIAGVVIWAFLTFWNWKIFHFPSWAKKWFAARPHAAIQLAIVVFCLPVAAVIKIVSIISESALNHRPWMIVGLMIGATLSSSILYHNTSGTEVNNGILSSSKKRTTKHETDNADHTSLPLKAQSLDLSFVRSQTFHLVFIVILGLLVFAVYIPSIRHLHRSDQWWLLLQTRNADSFADIWLKTYSYNRTRTYPSSDTALFRPVLFTFISLEAIVFKRAFTALWQLTGIGLHLILCSLIYRLLVQLQPRVKEIYTLLGRMIPASITLFFALNFNIMELIIWNHINGYILFLIFMVGSLIAFLRYDRSHRIRYLILAWILALLSTFTHEMGQIFAGVLAVSYLLLSTQPLQTRLKVCLSLLMIPIIYQVTNQIDYNYHLARGHFVPEGNGLADMLGSLFSMATITNTIHLFDFSVMKPYFPVLTVSYLAERLLIKEYHSPSVGELILSIPSYILFSTWLFLIAFGLGSIFSKRAESTQRVKSVFVVTLFATLTAYTGAIVLGRMNSGVPGPTLDANTYYAYIFMVFWITLSFPIWTFTPVEVIRDVFNSERSRLFVSFLLLILLLTAVINELKIYVVNRAYADFQGQQLNQIETLTRFVSEHKDEPGFGLAPLPDDSFSMSSLEENFGVAYPIILFNDYIDLYSPSYLLTIKDSEIVFIPAEDYPLEDNQPVYPDIIETQECFIIAYFRDQYWAVPNLKYIYEQDAFAEAPRGFVESDLSALMPKVEAYTEEHMNYKTSFCDK